jgi:hypothetical protein
MRRAQPFVALALWLGAAAMAGADPSLELPSHPGIPMAEPAVPAPTDGDLVPDGFRHFGDYILEVRVKITDGTPQVMPIKPLRLRVYTDGITVRVHTEGDDSGHSSFKIYRSDGIGRQAEKTATVEIIPGVQALSEQSGIVRHLRLSRETLTLTVFPGVSNQTIISTARAASGGSPEAPPMSQGPRP